MVKKAFGIPQKNKGLGNLMKIQDTNLMKDEEYSDEQDDDDEKEEYDEHDGFHDFVSSPKELNVESGCNKPSNCSCKALVPLCLPHPNPGKKFLPSDSPVSRSKREVIPFVRFNNCLNNLPVTPVKDDSPINV